ncbi:MAG: hypothetical protein Q8O31_02065 [Rhodocyclaceae bacterium]|nr:hypothetical protein [Rhodocyclaceae bacterium]
MLHEHFDSSMELLWGKRKLTYSVMDKPKRQAPVVDGKGVNARIDSAMDRRHSGHKPSVNHPWRGMPQESVSRLPTLKQHV